MKDRKCGNCKYYADRKEGYMMGKCEYPVPDPLRHISFFRHEYEGGECQTLELNPSEEEDS